MIKSALKQTFRSLGWEIRRYIPPPPASAHLVTMLAAHGINLVFDIGANIGQFALELRDAGYKGRIVSFEALSSAWTTLNDVSRDDDFWEIAPRGVVGAENGEIDFHVSNESQCSSVLEMEDAVLKIVPGAPYVAVERIPMKTLDALGFQYIHDDSTLFVKADVQGFEDRVIKGAGELLRRTTGLYLELSLVPLYQGQLLYDDLIAEVKRLGFVLWDLKPEYFDPLNGRMIWGTGVFFRA